MLLTVLYYKIYERIFFTANIQGTFTKKMEVLEAAEKHLASYILKENASKEKENRKPKAFRHTSKWMRFHRNEHEQDAVKKIILYFTYDTNSYIYIY